MRAIIFAATIALLSPSVSHAVDNPPDVVIDGLTVHMLPYPTVARLPKPTLTVGKIDIGSNSKGTSPYIGTPLDGHPFISINNGSVADYTLKGPASAIRLIWGTPDPTNQIAFFGLKHEFIGIVGGSDIERNFPGVTQGYFEISSTTPIYEVAGEEISNCCFELGNPGAKYLPGH